MHPHPPRWLRTNIPQNLTPFFGESGVVLLKMSFVNVTASFLVIKHSLKGVQMNSKC